jgi:phosphoribosylamine-glycine ligase
MKVLVLGAGGREHALCWALDRSAGSMSGRTSALVAMPALPGAQSSSDTNGEAASAQQRACSRPPEPTTRTFMP